MALWCLGLEIREKAAKRVQAEVFELVSTALKKALVLPAEQVSCELLQHLGVKLIGMEVQW